jgi:hypothetical protein
MLPNTPSKPRGPSKPMTPRHRVAAAASAGSLSHLYRNVATVPAEWQDRVDLTQPRPSRTNERVLHKSVRGGGRINRIADLSNFPPNAQPVLMKSTFDEIMAGFASEGQDFMSLSLCAEVAYNESLAVTAQLPYPNPLRTAVACHLLDRLTPSGPGSTSFSPLLASLKKDVFCSIYANTSPSTFTVAAAGGRAFDGSRSHARSDVGAEDVGVSRLLNQATYYQDYHAQLKRHAALQDDFDNQMLANEKQKVVLARVITRWQSMLVDRLFAAWRNYAAKRDGKIARRGAALVRAARRRSLADAFSRWRMHTRDEVETRLVDDLQAARNNAELLGYSAAGDRADRTADLTRLRAALAKADEDLMKLNDDLRGSQVALEQRELRLREMKEEKAFWRGLALRLLTRGAPTDRTMRLPEECVLSAFDQETASSDGADTADYVEWSPSLMGELVSGDSASSASTFSAASLQTQVTCAALGIRNLTDIVLPTSADELGKHNPFRGLLRVLPVSMQRAILAFETPTSLIGVPHHLLVLGWANSVIQRGSVVHERLVRLHVFKRERELSPPPSVPLDIANPTLGDVERMSQLVGARLLPVVGPARNLVTDMESGTFLLLLAEALGCFVPEDLAALGEGGAHVGSPATSPTRAGSDPALTALPHITADSAVPTRLLKAGVVPEQAREVLLDSLLFGAVAANPDVKVERALDAIFHRVLCQGSIASHGIDAYAVCTGRAALPLLEVLAATMRRCTSLAYDTASPTASSSVAFAAVHSSKHRRYFRLDDDPLSPDECRAAVHAMQAAVSGHVTSGDGATKEADEHVLVRQYLERLHAYEVKWSWISEACTQRAIVAAGQVAAAVTAAPNLDGEPHIMSGTQAPKGESDDQSPLAPLVDQSLFAKMVEKAIAQVKTMPAAKALGKAVDSDLAQQTLRLEAAEGAGMGRVCEALLGFGRQIEVVFRSYAHAGEGAASADAIPHTRFQQFLLDHSLYNPRHFPKKHAATLFESLLQHDDLERPTSPADESALQSRFTGAPLSMDKSLSVAPGDGSAVQLRAGGGGTDLSSTQFGAALVYIAAAAATMDVLHAVTQSISTYGAGSGKAPPDFTAVLVTKLRVLCGSLAPMASVSSLSTVQASIYHAEVQRALSKSNAALLKIFTLAAGQDDDPEMSREEFLKLMALARIDVPAAELERVYAFFARDDGDGPSMVYREFLEALVVLVQLVQPSPLTPLADRVRGFLRKKEGSFISTATAALTLRKVVKK